MQLKNLNTKFIGRKFIYYKIINSTQSEILRRINENKIENGTVIFSEIQTEGKGTHGRKWYTEEINNIAFSLFIKMDCDISKVNGLTTKIAEIILEIFKEKYNIELQIKQPNDIVCKGKKIGGILVESKLISTVVKYLIIGIGINTNIQSFNNDIKDIATSIKNEFNINVDTQNFISEFCNKFEIEIMKRMEEK